MSVFEEVTPYDQIFSDNVRVSSIQEEMRGLGRCEEPCVLLGPPGCGKEYLARQYADSYRRAPGYKSSTRCRALICPGLFPDELETLLREEADAAIKEQPEKKSGEDKEPEAPRGLLYFDEISTLPKETLAVLPRINDDVWLTNRSAPLPFEDIITICATAQLDLPDKEPLVLSLGRRITVPGLEGRKEDLPKILEFFIRHALVEHPGIYLIAAIPAGTPLKWQDRWIDAPAKGLLDALVPIARKWVWPGNLRDLRIAVELSIFRAKNPQVETFVDEASDLFARHASSMKPRDPAELTDIRTDPATAGRARKILALLKGIPALGSCDKVVISEFLSARSTPFTTRQFADAIDGSLTTARNRLVPIVEAGVIKVEGRGRGTRYRVCPSDMVALRRRDTPLALPRLSKSTPREADVVACTGLLMSGNNLYLGGDAGFRSVALTVAERLRETFAVTMYFSFKNDDVRAFLNDVAKVLGQAPATKTDLAECARQLATAMTERIGEGKLGLLLLDHVETLKNSRMLPFLAALPAWWKDCRFVLVSDSLRMEKPFQDCGFKEL